MREKRLKKTKEKEYTQNDISLESSLLKALAIKKNYEQFAQVLDTKRLIPLMAGLLKDYDKYYKKYEKDINWDEFYTEWAHNWHAKDMDERDVEYYREQVFPLIRNSKIENSVYVSLLEREAAQKIEEINKEGFNPAAIAEVLSSLNNQVSVYQTVNDERVFKLTDVDLGKLDTSTGIRWFLPALQAHLDSLMSGQFWVVAADSNTGKSAFCISQAVAVLKSYEDKVILYCTSEDTKEDLTGRIFSNLYKDRLPNGFEDVGAKREKIQEAFKRDYNPTRFQAMQIHGSGDLIKIEQLIEKIKPDLVIIDMLDKLAKTDDWMELAKLYQKVRGWANAGVAIIGTSQSGNTEFFNKQTNKFETVKNLTDKHLAGSKSGKQGAAYGILSIGKDDDQKHIRYVKSSKRKRGRDVRVTCVLEERYSLYRELL